MADTIATREFIERTLDARVSVINTRLQDISGSTAENTADLLSAISSDVNETFSRMAQEGVTVESRTTADLKTALVRTINKVAEESAGSGGGGGTVTPPVEEEEQEPVNLLQAPVSAEANDEVETIVKLDYSLGLEISKKYRISGTLGGSKILDSIGEFKDQGGGMYQLIGYYPDEETAECAFIIFDKVTFNESFEPVLDDNAAVIMFSVSNPGYAPAIINSITLVEEASGGNLLQAPITATTVSGQPQVTPFDYALGLELGKSYKVSGTYGSSNTPLEMTAEAYEVPDLGTPMVQWTIVDADYGDTAIIVYDKAIMDMETGAITADENKSMVGLMLANTAHAPLTITSITLVVESTTAEPVIVEANDITAMFMEEEGMLMGAAIANASMKGWETMYTMGSKIEMVLNGSPVNLELFNSESDMFIYYSEGFDPNEDPFESGEPLVMVQVLLNHRVTEDFDMVEEQGTVGFMIQLLNPVNGTSTTIDKITLPPIAYKDINARVSTIVLGDAYPQFDLSNVYNIGQYGFAGYGSAIYSPFDLHIPANVLEISSYVFANAYINKITIDENAFGNDSYMSGIGMFRDADVRDGANSNIDTITMKLESVGDECFYGFEARELRLNFDKISGFGENSFRRCYVKSINSDVDGEWLFGDEETTRLEFGENAFRESQSSKLKFIYPNVNEIYIKDKAFDWQGYSTPLEDFVLQTSLSCPTFVLNESNAPFYYVSSLKTLIVPRAEISKNCIPIDLLYLDCYKLTSGTNPYYWSMETLIYRDTEQSFVPTELLSDSSPIMQGIGVVYVQDNLVDAYKNTYSDTVIVFRGISELV